MRGVTKILALLLLGGQFTWYGVPSNLKATYGAHPVAGVMFLRLRFH